MLAQLVERCTGIAEVMGSNPVRAWIFFQVLFTTTHFSSVLSCEDLLISSFHCSANMWNFHISKILIHFIFISAFPGELFISQKWWTKTSFGQNNLKTGFALPRQFFSRCPISDFDSINIIFSYFCQPWLWFNHDTCFPVIFGRTDFFIPFFQLVCQMIL